MLDQIYATGYIPSGDSQKDYTSDALMASDAPITEGDFDLLKDIAVKDQKSTMCCTAFSVTSLMSFFSLIESGKADLYSEGWLYGYRQGDEYSGEGDMLRNTINRARKYGVIPKSKFPKIGTIGEMKKLAWAVPAKDIEEAKSSHIRAFYRIQGKDEVLHANIIALMRKFDRPVVAGINVYSKAFALAKKNKGLLAKPAENDASIGGHAVVLSGIKTFSENETLRMRNSWGAKSGDKGDYYIPKEYPIKEAWMAFDYIPTTIVMTVGSTAYTLNGSDREMDTAPFIKTIDLLDQDGLPVIHNGKVQQSAKTYIPLRFIAEALGYEVEWQAPDTIWISEMNYKAKTKVGSREIAPFNGDPTVTFDAPVIMEDGKTFLPVRAVANFFGFDVFWDDKTKTITLKNF